jgi:hypothetical protein
MMKWVSIWECREIQIHEQALDLVGATVVVSTHQHQRYATRMTHHHDTTYQNLSISFLFQLLLMDEVKVILKKENILQ